MAVSKKQPVRVTNNYAPQAAAPKQEDVDAQLEAMRHQSMVRAREALRVKVLPTLESAILMVPSGPVRNRLTQANIFLLKALEELQA